MVKYARKGLYTYQFNINIQINFDSKKYICYIKHI